MHVPDGFFTAPASIGAGLATAGVLAVAIKRTGSDVQSREAPLSGLVAAFVFAAQMINFPVGAGTSGHLLGGTLAALLLGPWRASIALAVVLVVQALFADGGLSAIGINILLIGIVPAFVGYAIHQLIRPILPRGSKWGAVMAGVAAGVSVPVAAFVFAVMFRYGGVADIAFGRLAVAMVGVHTLIGIGEGLITGVTVGAVLQTRPDLVAVASSRDLPDGQNNLVEESTTRRFAPVMVVGLLVTLAVAAFLSPWASSSPDGLEAVAAEEGFEEAATDSALVDGPLADYGVEGVENEALSTGLAGVLGVMGALGLGALIFALAKRFGRGRDDDGHGDNPPGMGGHSHGKEHSHNPSPVGGHARSLYADGDSAVHRLRPHLKILAALIFVLAVVATPPEAVWAFGVHALALVFAARAAELTPRFVASRLVVEVPFVIFAIFLPLVAQGERVSVLGISLSISGLWAMWSVLAKATLGLATLIVLTATTQVTDLLSGLERLKVPAAFTTVAMFMVRYLDVIIGELKRMQIARISRGHDPRALAQIGAVGRTAGALFVRSYERGERVHLAMLSRGYTGTLPDLERTAVTDRGPQWSAATLPIVGLFVAALARVSV